MNFMFSLYHIHIINTAWVINKSFSSFFGRKMRIRKSQLVLVFQLHEKETKITTSPLTSTTITEILVALLVQPTQWYSPLSSISACATEIVLVKLYWLRLNSDDTALRRPFRFSQVSIWKSPALAWHWRWKELPSSTRRIGLAGMISGKIVLESAEIKRVFFRSRWYFLV